MHVTALRTLQHNVRYVLMYISSSNSTRWGLLMLVPITIIAQPYIQCLREVLGWLMNLKIIECVQMFIVFSLVRALAVIFHWLDNGKYP